MLSPLRGGADGWSGNRRNGAVTSGTLSGRGTKIAIEVFATGVTTPLGGMQLRFDFDTTLLTFVKAENSAFVLNLPQLTGTDFAATSPVNLGSSGFRDGQCRAFASPTATAQDREALVSAHVRPGAEIYADTYHADASLASDYPLHRVNHSRGEYVREGVHINTVESLWASQASLLRDTSSWVFQAYATRYQQRLIADQQEKQIGSMTC